MTVILTGDDCDSWGSVSHVSGDGQRGFLTDHHFVSMMSLKFVVNLFKLSGSRPFLLF